MSDRVCFCAICSEFEATQGLNIFQQTSKKLPPADRNRDENYNPMSSQYSSIEEEAPDTPHVSSDSSVAEIIVVPGSPELGPGKTSKKRRTERKEIRDVSEVNNEVIVGHDVMHSFNLDEDEKVQTKAKPKKKEKKEKAVLKNEPISVEDEVLITQATDSQTKKKETKE